MFFFLRTCCKRLPWAHKLVCSFFRLRHDHTERRVEHRLMNRLWSTCAKTFISMGIVHYCTLSFCHWTILIGKFDLRELHWRFLDCWFLAITYYSHGGVCWWQKRIRRFTVHTVAIVHGCTKLSWKMLEKLILAHRCNTFVKSCHLSRFVEINLGDWRSLL